MEIGYLQSDKILQVLASFSGYGMANSKSLFFFFFKECF